MTEALAFKLYGSQSTRAEVAGRAVVSVQPSIPGVNCRGGRGGGGLVREEVRFRGRRLGSNKGLPIPVPQLPEDLRGPDAYPLERDLPLAKGEAFQWRA